MMGSFRVETVETCVLESEFQRESPSDVSPGWPQRGQLCVLDPVIFAHDKRAHLLTDSSTQGLLG